MLATTATSGWAQSGIVRDTAFSSSKYSFTQYKRNSSTPAVTGYYSQYASDPSNVLKTEYNFSTARIDMWINSTKFATTNFDPNSYWGAQPWSSQYSAETGHCQSDVPGTSTAKSEYRSVLKKTGAGTWIAPAVFESVSPDCSPRYRIEWAGSPSFNVWTQ
jgi:hypothetical protein